MKAELQNNLERHVHILATEIGQRNVYQPQSLQASADYIREAWRRQGYHVVEQSYRVQGIDCANLEVTRAGLVHPEQIILIGAHYDTVAGSPGANDNASGIAALLEISRLFAAIEPKISVRFVAFVNEESPFFFWKEMGSLVYARAARVRDDAIRFMVSLETLACYCHQPGCQRYPPLFKYVYPDRGDFIAFVANLRSHRIMRQAAGIFRQQSDFPLRTTTAPTLVPGVAWSDHYSFWRQGYRAFMVTDTAFYRYPYYHSAEDTAEKLDYPALARLTDGLYRTFSVLADERA